MLTIERLSKSFEGIAAISDVTLDFPTGSLTAVIGPNGAGKTTLFNLISGALRADAGCVMLDGTDLVGLSRTEIVRCGIARAFQVASIFPSLTVEETLNAAAMRLYGRVERLFDGERGEYARNLESAGDTAAHDFGARETDEVGSVEHYATCIGPERPGDQIEQRGLAGAVRPDHGCERARREVEGDVADGGDAFERL